MLHSYRQHSCKTLTSPTHHVAGGKWNASRSEISCACTWRICFSVCVQYAYIETLHVCIHIYMNTLLFSTYTKAHYITLLKGKRNYHLGISQSMSIPPMSLQIRWLLHENTQIGPRLHASAWKLCSNAGKTFPRIL